MSNVQPFKNAPGCEVHRGACWAKRLLMVVLFVAGALLLAQQVIRRASGAAFDDPSPPPSAVPAAGEEAPLTPPPAEPEPAPDPYAWRNLFDGKTLDGWKVPQFGGDGEVTVSEEGTIVLGMGESMTGITYTGEVPRTNYEIQLKGMRLDGNDFFATTTFPVGENYCSFVTGGWAGVVVGLSNIDFYDASDNPTTNFFNFRSNVWYTFRIRVTDALIQAWIDDERMVALATKDRRIDIRPEVDRCRPLGISAWVTRSALRDIRMRKLRPEEIEDAAFEAKRLEF